MARLEETEQVTQNVRRLSELYSAVVADACDGLGRYDRVLSYRLRPLWPKAKVAGVARTQLLTAAYAPVEDLVERECDFIDSLRPNDVVVATTGGAYDFACWGELYAIAARARGCNGIVLDGSIVDSRQLITMEFPSFSVGFSPAHIEGRADLEAADVPVKCGDALIEPGDYIIGDLDGVVAVPQAMIEDVLEVAGGKAQAEDWAREDLESGRSARETWDEYGIM